MRILIGVALSLIPSFESLGLNGPNTAPPPGHRSTLFLQAVQASLRIRGGTGGILDAAGAPIQEAAKGGLRLRKMESKGTWSAFIAGNGIWMENWMLGLVKGVIFVCRWKFENWPTSGCQHVPTFAFVRHWAWETARKDSTRRERTSSDWRMFQKSPALGPNPSKQSKVGNMFVYIYRITNKWHLHCARQDGIWSECQFFFDGIRIGGWPLFAILACLPQ